MAFDLRVARYCQQVGTHTHMWGGLLPQPARGEHTKPEFFFKLTILAQGLKFQCRDTPELFVGCSWALWCSWRAETRLLLGAVSAAGGSWLGCHAAAAADGHVVVLWGIGRPRIDKPYFPVVRFAQPRRRNWLWPPARACAELTPPDGSAPLWQPPLAVWQPAETPTRLQSPGPRHLLSRAARQLPHRRLPWQPGIALAPSRHNCRRRTWPCAVYAWKL